VHDFPGNESARRNRIVQYYNVVLLVKQKNRLFAGPGRAAPKATRGRRRRIAGPEKQKKII
jgi:hypothetical protein